MKTAVADSIARIAEALERPRTTPIEVGNLWGAAPAFLVAQLGRAGVVVLPPGEDADAFRDDLAAFGMTSVEFPDVESKDLDATSEVAARMKALEALAGGALVVATAKAAAQPVPAPDQIRGRAHELRVGDAIGPLVGRLVDAGFENVPAVERPGEFASRGGIIDVYAVGAALPVRIELEGSRIASLRTFDAATQVSDAAIDAFAFSMWSRAELQRLAFMAGKTVFDHRPAGAMAVAVGQVDLPVRADLRLSSLPVPEAPARPAACGSGRSGGPQSLNLDVQSLQRFSGSLSSIPAELSALAARTRRLVVFCHAEGEQARLRELAPDVAIDYRHGRLSRGFVFGEIGTAFTAGHEIFNRYAIRRAPARSDQRAVEPFLEIEEGDFVVHVHHGIGAFRGIRRVGDEDFAWVEYAGGATLQVPAAHLDLLQKYTGGSDHAPALDRLGSEGWSERTVKAQKAAHELAEELLRTQALRQTNSGTAFPPDTPWQKSFEDAFPFEETPDQRQAASRVKEELEAARPMDRLISGDVGYGKTEIAMRAAFKVATSGRQVAVLVPTTILAAQHGQTFRERMAEYPLAIEVLSRFKTKGEQKKTLERLAAGAVDIAIGTHRLVQADVVFKDLGLVIIDEEQRFGVEHKEFLKNLRATVDVMTLTATPIPRTLHMALLGLRDISTLATPPQDRRSIRTIVQLRDDRKIAEAVRFELERGGQIFFVHNRVQTIRGVAEWLGNLVPEATIVVGHGQMHEDELEQAMLEFIERKVDVLCCTTIIESGLDIPTVNTIFIDDADRFGLADLHQLRGRVGRYRHQAYAYFLMPRDRQVTPIGHQRLKAIEEFSELGAGFKIAMRDLEIRGAGNIIGREQSGHIAAVGYEMYCDLLQESVRSLRGEKKRAARIDAAVSLDLPSRVPDAYVPVAAQRLDVYRRIAKSQTADELDAIGAELRDRFGPRPPEVDNLLGLVRLRRAAERAGILSIAVGADAIVMLYRKRADAERLASRAVRIVDDRTIHARVGAPVLGKLIELLESA